MVNILEVNYIIPAGDGLKNIFSHQKALADKYHDIERNNGLLQCKEMPVDLHDRFGQARLKDFAWRFTEELGEALEAITLHPDHLEHFEEEMADALHFLTEFTLLAGVFPRELTPDPEVRDSGLLERMFESSRSQIDQGLLEFFDGCRTHGRMDLFGNQMSFYVGRIVEAMGSTCNSLKNKPWKVSHLLTDVDLFKSGVKKVWYRFIEMCLMGGISSERLIELYFAKNQVNQFRQRSNY